MSFSSMTVSAFKGEFAVDLVLQCGDDFIFPCKEARTFINTRFQPLPIY